MKHLSLNTWLDIYNEDTGKRKRREQKRSVLGYYSHTQKPTCVRCGFDDIRALSIDHINGGGHQMRTQDKKHNQIYKWLKDNDYPSGYQTLCMNCQFIKRFEKGEENTTDREKTWRLSQLA